ncbi:MAG: FAD-dependent oxidoreductase [Armatimonadota bacterium]
MCAREIIEPQRRLPVADSADVIVCGGGLGGVAAAVAAARNGANTLLVERQRFLGGAAAAATAGALAGFRDPAGPTGRQVVAGIAQELVQALIEAGAAHLPGGKIEYAVGFRSEGLKYVLLRMCQEAGVRLRLDTWCCDAVVEGGCVTHVIVQSRAGRQALAAIMTVDATRDGDVAASAGVPCEMVAEHDDDGMTLMYRLAGIDVRGFERREGESAAARADDSPAHGRAERVDELGNSRASARIAARASLEELRRRRERSIGGPGEEREALAARRWRRIRAQHTLSEEDAARGRRFEDVVAVSPSPDSGDDSEAAEAREPGFDVPYRALLPLKVEGLLLADGCISAEGRARSATDLEAPDLALSQAAGTAAALCAALDVQPRELDVRLLQRTLVEQQAELLGRP